MSLKHDVKQLLRPYYLFNLFLSLSYVFFKKFPGLCNYLFTVEECQFDGRETEILFFLLIVVMIRTRRAGSVTMINYLSSSFIYTKIANLILWFYADFVMGMLYAIIFVLTGLLLPEPTYSGPNNYVYFHGLASLDEELSRDKSKTWLVTFYTAWNPTCVGFAQVFAKLSNDYNLDNLRFGKIDIGRYPDAAKRYNVSDSSLSKQLPTVILFADGKEANRRPQLDAKGKAVKFVFSDENVVAAFDIKNLYDRCKRALKDVKHLKKE